MPHQTEKAFTVLGPMKVEVFQEEVERTASTRLGRVMRGSYQRTSVVIYKSHGWNSLADFHKEAKKKRGFLSRENNVWRFDLGRNYGVHSYQEVSFHFAEQGDPQ